MSSRFQSGVLIAFIICLFFTFIKVIWLDNIYEFFDSGSEIGEVLFQIALAYVGGYIFYWIANIQTKRLESRKNYIINKRKVEDLIFSIQHFLIAYLVYVGDKESIKSLYDLTNIPVDGKRLKINFKTEHPNYNIIYDAFDQENSKKPFIYYDELLEASREVKKDKDKCIASYEFMPLGLIEAIELFNHEYQMESLLVSFNNWNDIRMGKIPNSRSFEISTDENKEIINQVKILRKHLLIFQEFFKNVFEDDYANRLNLDYFLRRHQYTLLEMKAVE